MFKEFQKIPRLSKDIVITEKLDWTNACIVITKEGDFFCQSKNQIITPENDNYWFANWAYNNKEELMKLWVGYHYWEWRWEWIQRKYNIWEKRFSLFVFRWEKLPSCISVVPILYQWEFDTNKINEVMKQLKESWSVASPWFLDPEWIIIFHTGSRQVYKKTFENDLWKRTK